MPAELLEGQHLEKLLEGADAARADDKRVGVVLHVRLALAHWVGENKIALLEQDIPLPEEIRADSRRNASLWNIAARSSSHDPVHGRWDLSQSCLLNW